MPTYTNIKKVTILLILMGLNYSFSQNITKIKSSDTIYVYFEKNDELHEQKKLKNAHTFNYLNDYGYYNTIWFYDYSIENSSHIEKRKRFLKKNKDIIINYDYLKNFNYKEATMLFEGKSVYLIDKKDVGCFKIKLIKVKVSGYSELSIE